MVWVRRNIHMTKYFRFVKRWDCFHLETGNQKSTFSAHFQNLKSSNEISHWPLIAICFLTLSLEITRKKFAQFIEIQEFLLNLFYIIISYLSNYSKVINKPSAYHLSNLNCSQYWWILLAASIHWLYQWKTIIYCYFYSLFSSIIFKIWKWTAHYYARKLR